SGGASASFFSRRSAAISEAPNTRVELVGFAHQGLPRRPFRHCPRSAPATREDLKMTRSQRPSTAIMEAANLTANGFDLLMAFCSRRCLSHTILAAERLFCFHLFWLRLCRVRGRTIIPARRPDAGAMPWFGSHRPGLCSDGPGQDSRGRIEPSKPPSGKLGGSPFLITFSSKSSRLFGVCLQCKSENCKKTPRAATSRVLSG